MPRDVRTRSPLTKVLASATYWLYADELTSMTDAARILYNDGGHTARARIRRMIERGTLRHYWRPSRTDPTNAVLVRRSEVEQVQQCRTTAAPLDTALTALLAYLDHMDPTPQVVAERDRTQQIQVTLHHELALLPQDG